MHRATAHAKAARSFGSLGSTAHLRDWCCSLDSVAGGTHHSAFSYDITEEYWEDFAEMLGIEYVRINKQTNIADFKQTLRNNEVYYMLNKALR